MGEPYETVECETCHAPPGTPCDCAGDGDAAEALADTIASLRADLARVTAERDEANRRAEHNAVSGLAHVDQLLAERAAHAATREQCAAAIGRERKRADSYLDEQMRSEGWRPTGDDLDALLVTIRGGLGHRRGIGATEMTTIRTLRTLRRALAEEQVAHAATTSDRDRARQDISDERHGWAIVERALRDRLEVVEASLTSERAAHAATTAKLAESDKALDKWTTDRDRIAATAGRLAEAAKRLVIAREPMPSDAWWGAVNDALRTYDQAGRGGEDETIRYADPAEDHAQGVCDSTTCALCIAHAAECVRPECSCRRSLPRPVSP